MEKWQARRGRPAAGEGQPKSWKEALLSRHEEDEEGEDEIGEAEYCLRSLRGHWRDTKGSSYEVLVDAGGVEIRTQRPTGKALSTRGLVYIDEKTGWIVWGRSGVRSQYWLSTLTNSTLVWERPGSSSFEWHRTGWPREEDDEGADDWDDWDDEEEAEEVRPGAASRRKARAADKERSMTQERRHAPARHAAVERDGGGADVGCRWRPASKQSGEADPPRNKSEAEHALRQMLGMRTATAGTGGASDGTGGGDTDAASSVAASASPLPASPASSPRVVALAARSIVGPPGRCSKAADARLAEVALLAALRVGGASIDSPTAGAAAALAPQVSTLDAPAAQSGGHLEVGHAASSSSAALPLAATAPMQALGAVAGTPISMVALPDCMYPSLCGGLYAPAPFQMGDATPTTWPVDPRYVSEQLAYYFSDQNLFGDEFLRRSMMPVEGWVSLPLLVSFPRLSHMGANIWALRQAAVANSSLELDGTGMFVRIQDPGRRLRWAPPPGSVAAGGGTTVGASR